MKQIADTPEPPYYAVVFTSVRRDNDVGYLETLDTMVALASRQPGFLGMESARDAGIGLTVSYWSSLQAIKEWKRNAGHQEAQIKGREVWDERYQLRICKVEQAYGFSALEEGGLE